MSHLIIKNFGPIKDVDFSTKKITVFIGNQSAGKSTLAKIISFCSWLEKEAILHQELTFIDTNFVEKQLLNFHKIKSYRNEDFYIEYNSPILNFKYSANELETNWNSSEQGNYGQIPKISYIPSTRNLIAIQNIETLPVSHDNVRDCVFGWLNIHGKYGIENKIKVMDLGITYYYNENSGADTIILNSNDNKEITLDEASSGLQSLIPLYVLVDYLTNWIYDNRPDSTYEKESLKINTIQAELRKITHTEDTSLSAVDLLKIFTDTLKNEVLSIAKSSDQVKMEEVVNNSIYNNEDYKNITTLIDNILNVKYSNIIIEEPEQNLFPQTQRDFIYHLIKSIKSDDRNHKLVLTTHSPYILYALNNCMMGGLLENKLNPIKDRLKCKESFIDPDSVIVYAIENGTVKEIQQKDGLIGSNFFEDNMKDLMDDFYKMLNFYGNDKNESKW